MTILYPAPRPVNPSRPFGAGILPPDGPPPPPARFEPAPGDRCWWAAESARLDAARAARRARLNRRRALRPAWVFGHTDRLRHLVDRARGLESYLNRERCDAAGRPDLVAGLDARLAALARRLWRLTAAARDAARLDRHLDRTAAESAATDALERGLIAPDAAEFIARTSLVGHDA